MKLKITVHGVAYEVEVEVLDPGEGFAPPSALPQPQSRSAPSLAPRVPKAGPGSSPTASPTASPAASPAPSPDGDGSRGTVNCPIAGTVVEIRCRVGDDVTKDQVLLVIDAMKMHTSIASPLPGRVTEIKVAAGDTVRENQPLVEIE